MHDRLHYKMYKKGKKWCCMAIAVCSLFFGTAMLAENSNADALEIGNNDNSVITSKNDTQSLSNPNGLSQNGDSQNKGQIVNNVANSEADLKADNNQQPQLFTVKEAVVPNATANKSGWQVDNGTTYYYKNNQRVTGQQTIDGKNYYFNNQGQRQSNYFLNQNGHVYYYQNDGTRLNDGFYKNWGHVYYFGNDGARLDNGFYKNWGHTYYFGSNGARWDNSFYNNWGHTYYFGNDGARWDNSFYNNWGHTYYFGNDGARWDNKFMNAWGHTYYFGNDGARWDNRVYSNWGRNYYFGNDGALLTNNFVMLNGNDCYANNQGVLSSVRYQSQLSPIMALEGCTVAALQMLTSVKNINIPLAYAYNHLPQKGGAYNSAGFVGIIPANELVNYGRQWDSGLRDISGSSLGTIYNWVVSGHPVIYYGFSAWETAYRNRNHAKVIVGVKNGKFHVYDSCYPSVYSRPGSFGSGPYGHGADSYLTWNQVASEYNGSGAITTV